jgi:hypothetical protein
MMSRVGLWVVLMMLGSAAFGGRPALAAAGEDAEEPKAPGDTEAQAPRPPVPSASVAAAESPPPPSGEKAVFGVGLRARYVSVPSWLLGFFTKHNMPLSTFGHYGIEGFRRRGNFQIALGFSYQNMSPPDGNWLGSKHDPAVDTKFLQFRGLALYTLDIAFTWQTMVTSWFGLHAGAGLGLAIVHGSIYPTVSQGCTETNLGDLNQCQPVGFTCANGVCTRPEGAPALTASNDVLPVVPVVNMLVGIDFRLPDARGWEAKIEAGFFDAFFAGLGIGYTF